MAQSEELVCPRCAAGLTRLPNSQLRCGYCGWEGPVPVPPEDAAVRLDTAVTLPFRVGREKVAAMLGEWLGKGLFRPSDLQAASSLEKLRALHVPAARVEVEAESAWSGYDSRTEYRTVTTTATGADGKPHQVTKQEPYEVRDHKSGPHFGRYTYWIPLAGAIDLRELTRLEPWETTLGDEEAAEGGEEIVQPQWEVEALRGQIQNLVEADERSGCSTHVEYLERVSTRWHLDAVSYYYLPIWSLAYRYRSKLWHVFVNGQSGELTGEKPVSWKKVAFLVVGIAALIGIIVLLVHLFGR